MGRVFLTCFHQLLVREKPSSTFTNADEAVRVFASLVTDDIQKLEASLADDHQNSSLSLQWCTALVDLLRKLHFHLLCFVQQFNNKPTMVYTEEYMKESLILLDFCNGLKSAIAEMNRYRLVVDVAAEKLLRSTYNKSEIERLETESKKLYVMEDQKGKIIFSLLKQEMSKTKSNKDANNIAGVVYAVKGTMNTVCSLLFSTIFYPVSIKMDDIGLYTKNFPDDQLKLLSDSLRNLICRFSEGINYKKCGKPVLVENIKMVESTVFEIKNQAWRVANYIDDEDEDKYLMSIDLLKNNCVALKEGLEMFESAVTELFEEAVKGRNKVLAMIAAV